MSKQDAPGRKPPTPPAPDEEPWTPGGPELDPEGTLTAPLPTTHRRGSGGPPPGASFSSQEGPLELARVERPLRAPEPPASYQEPGLPAPAPSRALRWLLVWVVLAGSAAGVYASRDRLLARWKGAGERPPPQATTGSPAQGTTVHTITASGAAPSGTLMVLSEPSGATVRVGGRVVGVTPLAVDNTWSGEPLLELSLPGYRAWHGRFRGGEGAQVNATLRRR